MTEKYCCELIIKIEAQRIVDLLSNGITLLDFEPVRMDLYFNEFKQPRDFIQYNREYILNNLSISEVDGGITTLSLYDKYYRNQHITPFFRFRIFDSTLENEVITCSLAWIAYANVDWLIKDEFVLEKLLLKNEELVYLIVYNQNDAYLETQKKKQNINKIFSFLRQETWGRKEIVNGLTFIAAPLMYFGSGYNSIIPIEELKKHVKSSFIEINGNEIIKIELSPLYEPPQKHRNEQKEYWKSTNLYKKIENYKKLTQVDFADVFKRRQNIVAMGKRKW